MYLDRNSTVYDLFALLVVWVEADCVDWAFFGVVKYVGAYYSAAGW
jgi:hypothetical protein